MVYLGLLWFAFIYSANDMLRTAALVGIATAIIYKLVLVTNNLKDFSNIKGLKIIDPYHI